MTAKTAAQRKAAERQRHKEAGRAELRGIYTYPECVPAIKAHATAVTDDAQAKRSAIKAAAAKVARMKRK